MFRTEQKKIKDLIFKWNAKEPKYGFVGEIEAEVLQNCKSEDIATVEGLE